MEATTNNTNERSLPSKISYSHSLSRVDDKLKNFQSYLRWMHVDQSDARNVTIFWSSSLTSLSPSILISSSLVLIPITPMT
ncbi:hypothetical protein GW17_00035948 [Ensete ventricosum]|nr:hypothetical protein GW17_00035948 [Ensete ventricosum]